MGMAPIPEAEFSWRPDTKAMIQFAGLAVVRLSDREVFHGFLARHGYELISLEGSDGLRSFRQQLDTVIAYEEDIGIPLADNENLDALADGWNLLPDPPRRLVLEVLGADRMWDENQRWTRGFLEIAAEASRRHLVGGGLLFTALVVPPDSPLIGIDVSTITLPGPLDRRQLERDPKIEGPC